MDASWPRQGRTETGRLCRVRPHAPRRRMDPEGHGGRTARSGSSARSVVQTSPRRSRPVGASHDTGQQRSRARDSRRTLAREISALWPAFMRTRTPRSQRCRSKLARADAEKQELAAAARALEGQTAAGAAAPRRRCRRTCWPTPAIASTEAGPEVPAESSRLDSSEPGERTWGETPAEFAAELAAAMPAASRRARQGPTAEPARRRRRRHLRTRSLCRLTVEAAQERS